MEQHRQIALDTETTGLDPQNGHRIIEIGAIEIINRRVTDNYFHVYINPFREIDEGAIAVHGITNEFLADKPSFREIISDFKAFIGNDELVIHNAPFDVKFINHEFQLHSKSHGQLGQLCKITDTLTLAREKHPGQRNNLDALCKRYSVDNSNRELHGALLDARLLAYVYLAMTGGQGSLLESMVQADSATNSENIINHELKKLEIPIVYANDDELKNHGDYINGLTEQNGAPCVWQKYTD